MSSLTTIFIPGTGYRDSYSPAAQFCFSPAVIPRAHTFNFLRPWCHLAVAAPLAAVAGCATQIQPAHWSLVPSPRSSRVAGIIHTPRLFVASLLFTHFPTLLCCIQCTAGRHFVSCLLSLQVKSSRLMLLSSSNWAGLSDFINITP